MPGGVGGVAPRGVPLSRLTRVGPSETMIIGCRGHPSALLSPLTTGGDVPPPFDSHETVDRRRHGRQEHRLVEVFDTAGQLDAEWQPLIACVARVSRLTFEKDTRSGLWSSREEIGCYACQIRLDAETLARAVRSHWGIENQDHYVRDVTLGEDGSRIRQKPGAMARIRSAALNILRANGIQNVSQALYINALNLDHLLALGSS